MPFLPPHPTNSVKALKVSMLLIAEIGLLVSGRTIPICGGCSIAGGTSSSSISIKKQPEV